MELILKTLIFLITLMLSQMLYSQEQLRVLNFQGENGFEHESKDEALKMVEQIGEEVGWKVVTTDDTSAFSFKNLSTYDVVVFNNNCGTGGRILSGSQQQAFQQYIRSGGGFVGIHCAGAIWKEEGQFQQWYEKLIGTKLVAHPEVQEARLVIEDQSHPSTSHLNDDWKLTDEWHWFSYNPRETVNVLISLDESTVEGGKKMGDHPFTWYQYFDGGRSFFTSLGHTEEIYTNDDYKELVKGGIKWAAEGESVIKPIENGLILDLNADKGLTIEQGNRVIRWENQVPNEIDAFVVQDGGRAVAGSGRPRLEQNVPRLNGHNSIVFHRQELYNTNEDFFDHLITGSGYTWFSVMSVYEQVPDLPNINSFFGNLKNAMRYEGIWAGLTDDNKVWAGGRNGITFNRGDENNPYAFSDEPLETTRFYLVMGRLQDGQGTVDLELFINDLESGTKAKYIVNPESNSSKMSIGQERDAIEHPGRESFDGEISRFLIYERPLANDEMELMINELKSYYNLK